MQYQEITPHASLAPYIHTYWELTGESIDNQWERNFPDGCAGLVINLGDTCLTDNGKVKMDFGKTYLVGGMTTFKDSFIDENTHLFGVCLKPGVVPNFYDSAPQKDMVDQSIQLEKSLSFDLDKFNGNQLNYLNHFFTSRFQKTNGSITSVIQDIHQAKGQVLISEIANKNFTTVRQLERRFNGHLGMSPKEYARIIRFQNAMSKIKESTQDVSLSTIAFACGYYDHAHLTNDFKRNTGLLPSQF